MDWIRLMYFYPMLIDDALIDAMGRSSKIVPYIDLPLQHINDRVLRRMARRVTREQTAALLDRLRRGIPGLAVRTTLITGFPGETDEAFEELVEFVVQQRFERLGVFTYSFEPSTPSAKLDGHVPDAVRHQRRDRLMQVQQRIALEQNEAWVGRRREVMVDRAVPDAQGVWVARSTADVTDVDGVVFVTESEGIQLWAGAITQCEVVAAQNTN